MSTDKEAVGKVLFTCEGTAVKHRIVVLGESDDLTQLIPQYQTNWYGACPPGHWETLRVSDAMHMLLEGMMEEILRLRKEKE